MKLITVSAIGCVLIWVTALKSIEANYLEVIACDVGQGDAALIQKGKYQMLIDTGPDRSVLICLGKFMPFWDRKIEAVMLSHSDMDHSGGLLSILERYEVGELLTTEVGSETAYYKNLRLKLQELKLQPKYLTAYNRLRGAFGELTLIHPSPSFIQDNALLTEEELFPRKPLRNNNNQFSIVAVLKYGFFMALFTGDIDQEISKGLNDIGKVHLLKVPHHGSKNGVTKLLLEKINPEYAFISVGEKNRYGHPNAEVLEMLFAQKARVLRTDERSHLILKTNGRNVWL